MRELLCNDGIILILDFRQQSLRLVLFQQRLANRLAFIRYLYAILVWVIRSNFATAVLQADLVVLRGLLVRWVDAVPAPQKVALASLNCLGWISFVKVWRYLVEREAGISRRLLSRLQRGYLCGWLGSDHAWLYYLIFVLGAMTEQILVEKVLDGTAIAALLNADVVDPTLVRGGLVRWKVWHILAKFLKTSTTPKGLLLIFFLDSGLHTTLVLVDIQP